MYPEQIRILETLIDIEAKRETITLSELQSRTNLMDYKKFPVLLRSLESDGYISHLSATSLSNNVKFTLELKAYKYKDEIEEINRTEKRRKTSAIIAVITAIATIITAIATAISSVVDLLT